MSTKWTDPAVRWAAFDFETTSANPVDARILEMGTAHYRGLVPASSWCQRFHPGIILVEGIPGTHIPREASAIHGITERHVRDCPPFGVVPEVAELLQVQALVTYNRSKFDLPILNRELTANGVYPSWPPHVDLFVFVQWHQRHIRGNRLEEVAPRFGIHLDQAHNAGADSQACAELLLRLMHEGLVPADIEEAAAQSEHYQRQLQAERTVWGPWVYRDRQNPQVLRLGASKKAQGQPLDEVDEGLLRWALDKADNVPVDVQALFRARVERWGPGGGRDKGQWDRRGPCPYLSPGQTRVQALIEGAPATCPGCAALSKQLAQLRAAPPDPAPQAAALATAQENARLQALLAAHPCEFLFRRMGEVLEHLPADLREEWLRASSDRMELFTSGRLPTPEERERRQREWEQEAAQAQSALDTQIARYIANHGGKESATPGADTPGIAQN